MLFHLIFAAQFLALVATLAAAAAKPRNIIDQIGFALGTTAGAGNVSSGEAAAKDSLGRSQAQP